MKKEKMKIKKWTGLLEALMVASLVTLMPIGSAQAEVSGVTEIRLWHVLLAISFFFRNPDLFLPSSDENKEEEAGGKRGRANRREGNA